MFLPYNTDAPVYYWPITTVAMIVVNIVAFFLTMDASEETLQLYMLETGTGFHPVQWLTSNFMHADIIHLLGNMITLWSFGLVVEGKLGPWKSALAYLGIGILHGIIVQTLMLGDVEPRYCLGASAIVYAMMAISLIWAPENSMMCVFFISWRPFFFELRIIIVVGIFVGLQILFLAFSGGWLSSELLHIVGAAIGFAVGIGLLKLNLVDCENWDVFSVWKGHHRLTTKERLIMEASSPEAQRLKAEKQQKKQERMLEKYRQAVQEGTLIPAKMLFQQMQHDFPNTVLPEQDVLLFIQKLLQKNMSKETIDVMRYYLAHYTQKAIVVRLKLAQVLHETDQPRAAMKLLQKINTDQLTPQQTRFYLNLCAIVKQSESHDTYEIAED